MEGKTNFSRRLKQFDGLTWLTLTPSFYDRSTPLLSGRHCQFCKTRTKTGTKNASRLSGGKTQWVHSSLLSVWWGGGRNDAARLSFQPTACGYHEHTRDRYPWQRAAQTATNVCVDNRTRDWRHHQLCCCCCGCCYPGWQCVSSVGQRWIRCRGARRVAAVLLFSHLCLGPTDSQPPGVSSRDRCYANSAANTIT